MEKGTHRALWVMATIGGLIILWLLLRGKNTTIVNPSNTAAPAGNIYDIASPGNRQWVGGASGLPNIAPLDESDCGCTSINGGNFFTSINDMLNQFMTGSRAAFDNYEQNVFNGYPSALTQYFNNPVGQQMTNYSSRMLTSNGEYSDGSGTITTLAGG
jgi:hypothetical protein